MSQMLNDNTTCRYNAKNISNFMKKMCSEMKILHFNVIKIYVNYYLEHRRCARNVCIPKTLFNSFLAIVNLPI